MTKATIGAKNKSATKNRIHSQNMLESLYPNRIIKTEERDSLNKAIIIGFNHPSHGEIIRIVEFCFKNFLNRAILIPISLPIYESIAEYAPLLLRDFGVELVPLLTNENFEYIVNRNPNNFTLAHAIRNSLAQYFYNHCAMYGSARNIILLPLSTDLSNTVFPPYITDQGQEFRPRVVPVLNALRLGSCEKANFVPLSVATPKRKNKISLNAFETYHMAISDFYSSNELLKMLQCYGPDIVEYQFHQRVKLAIDNKFQKHF